MNPDKLRKELKTMLKLHKKSPERLGQAAAEIYEILLKYDIDWKANLEEKSINLVSISNPDERYQL